MAIILTDKEIKVKIVYMNELYLFDSRSSAIEYFKETFNINTYRWFTNGCYMPKKYIDSVDFIKVNGIVKKLN